MSKNPPGAHVRILIISPNWIGDAVMAQPLLQLLKQRDQDCVIDILAPAWVAPVWRAMSEVAEVIEAPFQHGKLQLRERWRFARLLKQRGYREAYVLPNTLKFALIPWMAGIARRVGYRGEQRYGLINVMHHDDAVTPRAMVPFYAALAEAPVPTLTADRRWPRPTLHIAPALSDEVCQSLALDAARPLYVFAPGAEFGAAKRWPEQHFASLAQRIHNSDTTSQIVLLGSPKDKSVCEAIAAEAPFVHNMAGVTTLAQAVALISKAKAVVSNDSGLLHVASACNRPVLAIYGPTDPDHAPPFSDRARSLSLRLACAPCRQRECPLGHHHCMQQLVPDMVEQALNQILLPET